MNYFHGHVYADHSAVVKPLQQLLEGMNNPTRNLEWTDEATRAFFKFKDLISLQAQLRWSKSLTGAQLRWSTIKKKLLLHNSSILPIS